jgi:hypothetical protein
VVKKLYDDRGKECSRTTFRVIGVFMGVSYVGITILVLYLKSFIFSPIIQVIGFFALTSGYMIPLLLLISQRYTEAGMAPIFKNEEENAAEESMDGPDLSFTNYNNIPKGDSSKKAKKIVGGSYFKDYYETSSKQTSGNRKTKGYIWLLVMPYLTVLLIITCYFLILYSPVRTFITNTASSA